MGITDSKVVLATLSIACSNAEQNGRKEIKQILSDTQFVACLTKLWKQLPEHSKKQIYPGYKRNKQIAKAPKEDRIKLSKSLQLNIASWEKNPASFLDVLSGPSRGLNCPVIAIYRTLSEIETRYSGDTIRLRFLKVLFHHLKDRCCANYLRRDAIEWMTLKIVRSGYDVGDTQIISSKIKDWAYVGGKYDALSRDIGDLNTSQDYKYLGNLFCLPEEVTDRFILKELPVKGDSRKRVIDSLLRRGIREQDDITKMDCLADHIFGTLWNKIESSIRPNEQQEEVSVSLMNWCQTQGARVIRLQNGDFRDTQRSNEIDMSPKDPINAVSAGIGDKFQTDKANAGFPMMDRLAQIDPTNAFYPSMENTSQMTTVGFQCPTMEGVAQIDPSDAVFPSMESTPQVDNVNAAFPTMEEMAQIDPTNAIYPSMENTSHTTTVNFQYPTMEGVSQTDPTNAVYSGIGDTSLINNVDLQCPTCVRG